MRFILTALATLLVCGVWAQTPPSANFTGAPTTVCQDSPVSFTSTSTQGTAPITDFAWDFGDGNSALGATSSHAYTAPGVYTVILTVTAANGQADAEVKSSYITVNPKPVAVFTASTNGCTLPVGVTFNNTSTGGTSYAWNFGNGQTSTAQSPPMVNYTTGGNYNVTLTVTNGFGCTDSGLLPLIVSNYQAGINAPATACAGVPVTINDASTVGANAWNWTFGGGSPGSSTSQNPTVTFASPGTYTISLTSQNTASGCSANTTAQITVLPNPVPSFTADPTTGCAPQAVTFTNNSPAGTTFTWSFGDGQTFTGENPPAHTYASNGTYNVTLTMTATNGCRGTVTQNALINLTAPAASFTSDVVDGCTPLDVNFTSTAFSTDPIVDYAWNFGNGNTFNGQVPPQQTYPTGVYDVSLTITTQSGCISTDTIEEYIQVGEIDLVDFTLAETPACAKTNVNFTNESVISVPHDEDEVIYSWDFGDGGTSNEEDAVYQFPNDTGYFDVRLIVNFRGCLDTMIQTDAVYIKPPISRFSVATPLYCNLGPNQTVTVNDNSIINSINPVQDAEMFWRWGDGTPDTHFDDPDFDDANKGTTTHNYTQYGSYTIKQVIYNHTTGCADSTTGVVHISRTEALFTPANDSVCEGLPMVFNASASNTWNNPPTPHSPLTYEWNMGNGETTTGVNPTYTYTSSGTYTVTLVATNAVGCSDVETFTPFRALETPTASLSANDNAGCAPFTVVYTNGSQVNGNGAPLQSFLFTFPGGTTETTTSAATTVDFTYTTEGTFPVTIVATDQFGCISAPASTSITVTKPVANFTHDAVVCNEEDFTVTNASNGAAPLSYQWFKDNTQQATTTNYSTSFNDPENNSVSSYAHILKLIVTDVNGCKDTIESPITVSKPVANFSFTLDGAATNPNGDFVCPPVFADFTDETESFGSVSNYAWIFGDGKQSTLQSPQNTYVFPGTYSASLGIVDEFGCTDDTIFVDFLTIFGPTADPSWSADPGGCGQDITFDIGTTSNVTDIVWNTGDGAVVDDSTNFVHTYQGVDTYNATVSVFDDNNCQVVYPLDPIIIPDNGINAFFTASPNPTTIGNTIVFTDGSTSLNPLVSWTWDLGTLPPFTNSNGNSVSNSYASPGLIDIILTVEDAVGCFDQYTLQVFVDGSFELPNIITVNGDGTNEEFEFAYNIFSSFDIVILNRWGNVIQDLKNQTGTKFWDGRKNGEYVTDGVYFYLLTATLLDGTIVKKDGFLHVVSGK